MHRPFALFAITLAALAYTAAALEPLACNLPECNSCNAFTLGFSAKLSDDEESTIFCYHFKTENAQVISWDLVFALDGNNITDVDSSGPWALDKYRLSNLAQIQANSGRVSKCFSLPGSHNAQSGEVWVRTPTDVCVAVIPVPANLPSMGSKKCVLDEVKANWVPGVCSAKCDGKQRTVRGILPLTKPILERAVGDGECESTVDTPCDKLCTVDCAQSLEPSMKCTANCATPVVTMTRFWTVATPPLFGGNACNPLKSFETSECSTACPVNCKLDSITTCGECTASCPGNRVEQALGTKTCSKRTISTPTLGGAACTNTEEIVPCTKLCPVDCTLGKLPPPESVACPTNCKTTNTVFTIYATANPPKNNGRPCVGDPLMSVVTCDMPAATYAKQCQKKCVVDGIPTNNCLDKCSKTPQAAPFTTTATYPITLAVAPGGESACPTVTQMCDCKDCQLGPTPTKLSPCDATCTAFDDQYAVGTQTLTYPVVLAAKSGGKCETTSLIECYQRCRCNYLSSSVGSCAYTKTISNETPWSALGKALVTMYGDNKACISSTYKSCWTTLSAKFCTASASCSSCSCTSQKGPDYLLTAPSKTCQYSGLVQGQYGGQTCATTTRFTLKCQTMCPGCSYSSPPICGCSITSSTTGQNSKTTYTGFRTCNSLLHERLPQVLGNTPATPLCSSKVDADVNANCGTVLGPSDCYYRTASCGYCTYTRTEFSDKTFYGLGNKVCIAVDQRSGKIPAECAPKLFPAPCREMLPPTPGIVETYCDACAVTCRRQQSGVMTQTVSCHVTTLVKPGFGAPSLGPAPVPPHKTCTRKCQPTPGWNLLPPYQDERSARLHAFFSGNAQMHGSQIGGAMVVCGTAQLINVDVGRELRDTSVECDARRSALYVNRDLTMIGNVWGGVWVGGKCTPDGITVECGNVTCSHSVDQQRCEDPKLDCRLMTAHVLALSRNIAARPPNAIHTDQAGGTQRIVWFKDNTTQTLAIRAKFSNPIKPFNGYSRPLDPNNAVFINVFGRVVKLGGFSLKQFSTHNAEKIVWNFPQALQLDLSDITIYGNVLAPLATVRGNAVIKGRVAARNYVGTPGASIDIRLRI